MTPNRPHPPQSAYDAHADFYYEHMKPRLEDGGSFLRRTEDAVLALLAPVEGLRVCDLACGGGHLSRRLADAGARVTGVDLSRRLLRYARADSAGYPISFLCADARGLHCIADASFDALACNMALMDIDDLQAAYAAAARVLRPGGRFVFSVVHPCFGAPFSQADGSPLETDANGDFVSWKTFDYVQEGHWRSSNKGIRGTFGAIHRTLATYLNALDEAGFRLRRLEEPALPPADYEDAAQQLSSKVPRTLVCSAERND